MFKTIQKLVLQIWKYLAPPYKFSWETLFALSVLAWLLSALTTRFQSCGFPCGVIRFVIGFCGFVFLILAVAWYTRQHTKSFQVLGLNTGPWITGGLLSVLCFGSWITTQPWLFWVSWPITTAIVAIVSEFISSSLSWRKIPAGEAPRVLQRILIFSFSHLLLSCWIYFGFQVHEWSQQYPSLVQRNLSRSGFVVRLEYQPDRTLAGTRILQKAEEFLFTQLHQQSWSAVEQWLLRLNQEPNWLQTTVFSLPQFPVSEAEKPLWQLQSASSDLLLSAQPGYSLTMFVLWRGPDLEPNGYFIRKTCQIAQVFPPRTNRSQGQAAQVGTIAQMSCAEPDLPEPIPAPLSATPAK